MKNKILFIQLFLIGLLLGVTISCKKEATKVVPTIKIAEAYNITDNSAISGGLIIADGGAPITASGVCWSKNPDPTIADSKTTDGASTGSFTSTLTVLSPGTSYNLRAYATNIVGTSYSSKISLTTLAVAPVLTTAVLSNITSTTVNGGGGITNDGGAPVTARGVCWSTSQNPTTANSITSDGTGIGNFTSSIIGLTPGATYYIRAYATNSIATVYGNQLTFTTLPNLPVITTTAVTGLTSTAGISGGNVTIDGGATVTARGVCWSTTQNPTVAGSKTTDGTGTGSFASSITGLTANTTYYIRAYATNSLGTAYGTQLTILTPITIVVPTISTTTVSLITSSTATSGGNITGDGGATVTARGVCWSKNQQPTITNSKSVDGTGLGSFTSNLTGLTPNTTYYYRSYATNSAGTGYGNELSFLTLQPTGQTMTDIEGNVYKIVTIGTQTWMAENLRTTKYRNGESIPLVTGIPEWVGLLTGGMCWFNDGAVDKVTYGALYNWYAATDARKIAPLGWHVPTDAELTTLADFNGGASIAGGPLKETGTVHWLTPNNSATNITGFTMVPGGQRNRASGLYVEMGASAYMWSTTESDANSAYLMNFYSAYANANRNSARKIAGCSIRCIKD